MSQVPPRSLVRSISRRLAAGLGGGLSAGLLLSLLDWWLMLRQGGRGLDGESVPAACYAFLLFGAAGAVGGLGLSLVAAGIGKIAVRVHAGRSWPCRLYGIPIGALCFAVGGALLIRFGWMPQWYRVGSGWPATGAPRFSASLLCLTLLAAALPVSAGWLWRRFVPAAGRGRPGRVEAMVAFGLVLVYAGALAGWTLAGPGRSDSVQKKQAVVGRPSAGPTEPYGGGAGEESLPVVVLLLDTLRWDALSCYGNGDLLTPHLDRFCREAVQFELVRAQASWTKPSIATLLTSTYPTQHGARGRADRIRPSIKGLAQVFCRAGYRTGAVVANGNLSPAFGFARGFDHYRYLRPEFVLGAKGRALGLGSYRIASAAWQLAARGRRDHRHFKRDAAEVNRHVLEWVEALTLAERRRFFLFVNYVDPHDPYFKHPYDGSAIGAVDSQSPSPRLRDEMASLYAGEVAFLDHHLGRLFAHLGRLGIYERALIVITSDHGEEFLDHGGWWHGLTLYEEQVRVPLLVRLPGGVTGGRLAGGEAGLIDVAPGLLELAGLQDRTPDTMAGWSLARWLGGAGGAGGGDPAPRPFYADETLDGNILASLVEGRWKYVRANANNPRGLPREALYDMVNNPEERINLVGEHLELAAAMSSRLDRLRSPGSTGPPAVPLDEETVEHLRVLGYLQ